MNIFDKLRNTKFVSYLSNSFHIGLPSNDPDWQSTDDLELVLNKLANDFSSCQLFVGTEENTQPVPPVVVNPNLLSDWRSLFYRYFYLNKKYGVTYLWVTGAAVHVLENDNCNIDYNFINVLNLTSYNDIFRDFRYTSGGKTVNLLTEDGIIIPVFDIGFSHNNYHPIVRAKQIEKTLRLSAQIKDALIGSFKRIALMLLSPKDSSGIPQVRISDLTDKNIKQQNEKFNDDFKLKDNAIAILNKSYDVVNTNPDNRKLNGIDTANHVLERICTRYGLNYKLIRGETKYDDLAIIAPEYYVVTLQKELNKFLSIYKKALKIKEDVQGSYTNILETILNNEYTNNKTIEQEVNE